MKAKATNKNKKHENRNFLGESSEANDIYNKIK